MIGFNEFVAKFTGKHAAIWLTMALFTLTSMTPHRANFSGQWKLNDSKTKHGNFLCIYDQSDRMWSKTMKISEQANALTIEVSNSYPSVPVVKSREKLTFDGKESEVNRPGKVKKFIAKLSPDRKTITINSHVSCLIEGKNQEFEVRETWTLINNGNAIAVHYDLASDFTGARAEDRVYEKVN